MRTTRDPGEQTYDRWLQEVRRTLPRYRFRGFARDARLFRRFCRATARTLLPASTPTILRYIASLKRSRFKGRSIKAMLRPITNVHVAAGYRPPLNDRLVQLAFKGMQKLDAPPSIAPPLAVNDYRALMHALPAATIYDLRTRAMCACAFWGMVSASELATFDLDRVDRYPNRWTFRDVGNHRKRRVMLDRGTDPRCCPVAALEAYLSAINVADGPVWRNVHSHDFPPTDILTVRCTIKHALKTRPAFARFSPDSLKNGGLAAAFHGGVPDDQLVLRAGFCDPNQLERRLRQIVTPQPGDRPIAHGGLRAGHGRRGPYRFWRENEKQK